MYNSRGGFAIFYRYQPRPIESLCTKKLVGRIKIHDSVLDRLELKTAGYTPENLPTPGTFDEAVTHLAARVASTMKEAS